MRFKKVLIKLLKSIDIYGQKIEMNFNSENVFPTVCGGMLTLIVTMILGLGCWFYGQELILKRKPQVISSQRPVYQAERINITADNLVVMVGVQDQFSKGFIDPTIFSVRAVQQVMQYVQDSSTGSQVKSMVPFSRTMTSCSMNAVGIPQLQDYFSQVNLPKMYCFSPGQDIYMEGDFDAQGFAQVFIYIDKCTNSTSSSVICQPIEVIDEKLKFTKFSAFLSDKLVDPLLYEEPFHFKGINLYSPTSSSFPKEIQLYFTNSYIESDVGVLYEDINTLHNFVFTEMKETTFFSNPNTLVRVLLRIQKQRENLMQRRYLKFVDVVAQIGGLLKILTTIGSFISLPFSKLYLNKAIIDEIFNFKFKQNDEKILKNTAIENKSESKTVTENDNQTNNQDCKLDQQNNQPRSSNEVQKKIKQSLAQQDKQTDRKKKDSTDAQLEQSQKEAGQLSILEKEIEKNLRCENKTIKRTVSVLQAARELFKVTRRVIKYSFTDFFLHITLPWGRKIREKRSLVEQGVNKVIGHLDVLFILNKLLEIDKLKSVIFDEDQLHLFEYIPKPVLFDCLDDQESKDQLGSQDNHDHVLEGSQGAGQIERLRVRNLNIKSKKVYSSYDKVKSDPEKALDAFTSLNNISKKEKKSRIDDELIKLIDPNILLQFKNKKNNSLFAHKNQAKRPPSSEITNAGINSNEESKLEVSRIVENLCQQQCNSQESSPHNKISFQTIVNQEEYGKVVKKRSSLSVSSIAQINQSQVNALREYPEETNSGGFTESAANYLNSQDFKVQRQHQNVSSFKIALENEKPIEIFQTANLNATQNLKMPGINQEKRKSLFSCSQSALPSPASFCFASQIVPLIDQMEQDIQDGESITVFQSKSDRFQVNHSNYKVSIPNNESNISSFEISACVDS